MHRTIYLAGAAALATTTLVFERQALAQDRDQPTQLETILVTDGLTPIEQEKSGRAFTVISGAQLEKDQVRYVTDALRQVPGFAVSRSGPNGSFTQVRVRGAEANHLLVMIDGVEAGDTWSSEFDFGGLLVDDIDRIEILRGPQSAFWGSNATAGVVNIITKRGSRDGWRVKARSETGTDGTFLGGVSLSGGAENYDVALSGVVRQNEGYNISDFGTEKDGDRNATLNGRFNIDVTDSLTLDGTLRYVNRKNETDPQDFSTSGFPDYLPGPNYGRIIDAPDWTKSRELTGSVGATLTSLDGALTQKMRFAARTAHRDSYASANDVPGAFDPAYTSDDGDRYTATYQASYSFDTPGLFDARHRITGGYEWEKESFKPSHNGVNYTRRTDAVVGEYRGEFLDQFNINAALRQDFNDRFDDATTYSLSGSWRIPGSETRLHASYGKGVTNPTFYEQFGYNPGYFIGNPDLKPEESKGWDIGIEQGFLDRRLVLDVTYFNQDLTNEIAYDAAYTSSVNLDGVSKRQGVEVSVRFDLQNGFTAGASYTYTDSTEQAAIGGPRIREARRPKHAGSLNAAYSFLDERARIFGEATFNGEMIDNAFVPSLPSRVTLDGFTVVNVGGSFRFTEHLEGYVRIENLFDEDYEEVFGYNTPGRTAYLGLKGSF
ncbi:TonB-dependent receptor plug domain-containing protein [Hoeflea olei]|uniref:TonB-dependent receptor n=1 Tax=Hoeflea olei TaxID=1480615 RepID=A0A1C1YRG3_9HYPH|nr:TonB-dependent receptor [Hoeflea olei]OCW55967.1 hypothetical protein AWJ14_12145 [Hoeflea olei]